MVQDEGAPFNNESVQNSLSNTSVQILSIDKSTGSLATLTLAKKWVKNCIDNHEKCTIKFDSIMPSRLLEIGLSKEKENYQVRLCTSNIPPGTRYATLSHVWGSLDFVKLVKDNVSDFQKDIPLSSLTKTFQDALKVASEFGFHYLWIDSLCIIQNDADDWQRESAHMASVYGGSSLNIAATGARDGNDGLFFDRNLDLVRGVELMTSVEKTNRPEIRETNGDISRLAGICTETNFYRRACLKSPLFQRAWTVQERFLTPRTLHFSKHRVILECRAYVYHEIFPGSYPDHSLSLIQVDNIRGDDFRLSWCNVVDIYSRSKLTVSSDKLVALSGIAKYFARKYNAQYLSGIWKEHLPIALLWHADDECVEGPLLLRGPSWSWPSRNGVIAYLGFYSHFGWADNTSNNIWDVGDFKILDIQVNVTPPDSFGHCLGGTIRIACAKLPVGTDISIERYDSPVLIGEELCMIDLYFDNGRHHSKAYLLKITALLPKADHEAGLLITPVAGRKGFFTRIGVYKARWGGEKVLENVRSNPEPLCDDELSLYEEISGINEAGKQMYIITLI
ncbi:hypothetical protein OCU04_010091 [Sclerotinia nivalis]|uniref:Heterokaryon incompatibility domain-containing protein n=1 Tax=Sclerotinia nivalis TaxID=352851 RepID=A0A9X0AF24_9HELO|nr:hypothetical protein OCU04_010091 [Sclerotinia nivalis]